VYKTVDKFISCMLLQFRQK